MYAGIEQAFIAAMMISTDQRICRPNVTVEYNGTSVQGHNSTRVQQYKGTREQGLVQDAD